MGRGLLEIKDPDLKFTFELKKLCSCSVELINKTDDYVAFKVKTTSPKRYCVRPNIGIILPKATYEFTVTMQALRNAPPDMQLKDKFLIQSTIVPFGTKEEELSPSFFSKDCNGQIEEHKLKVILVSPPHSPVLQPINGALKQEPAYDAPILKEAPILRETPILEEALILKAPPILKEEPIWKETPILNETPILKETPLTSKEQAVAEDENLHPSHFAEIVDDLQLKIINLEIKLNEADRSITMLTEQKNLAIQERDKLQEKIVLFRRKNAAKVQVGFPLFFVVFIALVSLALGYMLHA